MKNLLLVVVSATVFLALSKAYRLHDEQAVIETLSDKIVRAMMKSLMKRTSQHLHPTLKSPIPVQLQPTKKYSFSHHNTDVPKTPKSVLGDKLSTGPKSLSPSKSIVTKNLLSNKHGINSHQKSSSSTPSFGRGASVYCRNDDKSLTTSKLKEYLQTISGETHPRGFMYIPPGESVVSKARNGILLSSRITTKEEKEIFPGKEAIHVECKLIRMYNKITHSARDFYMNFSPCTDCAPQLLKAYGDLVSPKNPVTIHMSRLWTGGKGHYKKCLAKLIKKGFKLVVTDWEAFKDDYLHEDICKEIVSDYSKKKEFKKHEKELREAIENAEALAKSTSDPNVVDKWCPERDPKWCD